MCGPAGLVKTADSPSAPRTPRPRSQIFSSRVFDLLSDFLARKFFPMPTSDGDRKKVNARSFFLLSPSSTRSQMETPGHKERQDAPLASWLPRAYLGPSASSACRRG